MTTAVYLCRGCCCGSAGKHPSTDHAAQVVSSNAVAVTVTTACLEMCEHSNVVVVDGPAGTRWFGSVLEEADMAAVLRWVEGGPASPLPALLRSREVTPSALAMSKFVATRRRRALVG